MPTRADLERLRSPSWMDWLVMGLTAAVCLWLGYFTARLIGFPFYPGYQGALSQQPLHIAGSALAASLVLGLVALRFTVPAYPLDSRVGAAMALLTMTGLSLRGSGMGSVMLAAGERSLFWLLSGELAALSLIVVAIFALRSTIGRLPRETKPDRNYLAGFVQFGLFVLALWMMGCSYKKAQATYAVLFAGVAASVVSYILVGATWRHAWVVPLIAGILGYVANAMSASGVEVAKLANWASPFAMPVPLDYAAMGPAGILLGELLYGEQVAAETAPAPAV